MACSQPDSPVPTTVVPRRALPLPVLLAVTIAAAQPQMDNLLVNATASEGVRAWRVEGSARTEELDGVTCFTLRNGGAFTQEVELPAGSAGRFAVLLGRGRSERIGADGTITGLPYLYALVIAADRGRILDYWQGQNMLARPTRPDEWARMSGVYKVPEGASYLSVQLRQAEASGAPHDGSAARFSAVRLYLFSSEGAARAYAEHFQHPR